jgi:hypothetical protein
MVIPANFMTARDSAENANDLQLALSGSHIDHLDQCIENNL